MFLSVILLASVRFETAYIQVAPESTVFGGPPLLNLSSPLSDNPSFFDGMVVDFIQPFAVLSDNTRVSPFSATTQNCKDAGDDCFSFAFAVDVGSLMRANGTNVTVTVEGTTDLPAQATAYVLQNATAYQLEYYPLGQNLQFYLPIDCRTIMIPDTFTVCVKEIEDDIAACKVT